MKEKYEKIVKFSPAYDKRNSDPKKNYGIHGVELRFILKGKKGATHFVLYTNWQLPHVTEEFLKEGTRDLLDIKVKFVPLPADLGYHSPKPMFEGHTSMANCPYLDGKPCYYDGSGLRAEDVYEILLKKGSIGVWSELEKCYKETFEELKNESINS